MIRQQLHRSVLLLALSAAGASAQEIDSPYRFVDPRQQVNVFVGAIETDAGELGLGPESDGAFGARYGIRITGPFSIEAAGTLFPTSRSIRDRMIEGEDTTIVTLAETDLLIGIASADLRFDITGPRTWHRLMPFALLGVGAAFPISEDDAADADVDSNMRYDFGTRLTGELGLGVEWFPIDWLTLRLDARNMLWKIETPAGFQTLDTPSEEWVQNFLLSAGVSFRF